MQKVTVVPGLSRDAIERTSLRLLRELQPRAVKGSEPTDIESIFEFYIPEKFGIETGYTDLSSLGPDVLGYTDAAMKISKVDSSLSNAKDVPTARRFRATVGHEAGHCLKHVNYLNIFTSSTFRNFAEGLYRKDRHSIKPYEDPEWQAWEFSQAWLMPKHLILRYRQKGYDTRDMADCFDVNPAFVEVRLRKLKIKPLPL